MMKGLKIAVLILAAAVLIPGCFSESAPDTQLGEAIYPSGEKNGPFVANLHEITALTGEPTNERGVWGGNMSRLAVTSDGVYTAYMTGGGDGEDLPRPFTLYRLASGSDTWEALGSGNSHTDAVVTLAGSDGRVYVVTLDLEDNMKLPSVFVYDPAKKSFDVYRDASNPSDDN